jgi:hypothetical protein
MPEENAIAVLIMSINSLLKTMNCIVSSPSQALQPAAFHTKLTYIWRNHDEQACAAVESSYS